MLNEKIKRRIIDAAQKLKEPVFKQDFSGMAGVDKGVISRYIDNLEYEGKIKVRHMGRFYMIMPLRKQSESKG